MKPLFILVEGQTEEEFVKDLLRSYLFDKGVIEVSPIKVSTKAGFKGGFVKYDRLKKDAELLLKQRKDCAVSTFVDYFRLPNDVPNYKSCQKIHNIDDRISCLELGIAGDVGSERFSPYIQKYEFESVLFSSNVGFENYYDQTISKRTAKIVEQFPNPEDINDNPTTSPSNRLKKIVKPYNKILDGNILALHIGIEQILEKCPRFRNWVEGLIQLARK